MVMTLGIAHASVWVDAARKRVGQPVQRDGLEDLLDWWICVGPFQKLLADPVEGDVSVS